MHKPIRRPFECERYVIVIGDSLMAHSGCLDIAFEASQSHRHSFRETAQADSRSLCPIRYANVVQADGVVCILPGVSSRHSAHLRELGECTSALLNCRCLIGQQEEYLGGKEAAAMPLERAPVPADEAERVIAASEVSVSFRSNLNPTHSRLPQSLLNSFSEDTIHISVHHLLQVVAKRGWACAAVFHVTQYATDVSHYVAVLDTGHPICDCMMGTNLGLPCRHFYSVLRSTTTAVTFHLGLFNRRYRIPSQHNSRTCNESFGMYRWLTDPSFNVTTTPAVMIGHNTPTDMTATVIPRPLPSLHRLSSPQPNTCTLPPKVIHHQAITKFQDVLRHVHTEEELQKLTVDINRLM